MLFEDLIDQQATMFQPVGGMDAIPAPFAKRLGDAIRRGHEMTQIRCRDDGVRITHLHRPSGATRIVDADDCIVTIPSPVLATIASDFAPAYRAAIATIEWQQSVKIAWQSRRFWEYQHDLYGGMSWIKGITNMVWYPSAAMFSDQGIILGSYTSGAHGEALARLPLLEQFETTRAMVERLHPGHGAELRRPMGIAWSKVPYSLGEAAHFRAGASRRVPLAEQVGRALLLRGRLSQQGRHVAGERDDVGAPDHRPDRRAPPRERADGSHARPCAARSSNDAGSFEDQRSTSLFQRSTHSRTFGEIRS